MKHKHIFVILALLAPLISSAQNTWFRIHDFNHNHNQNAGRIIEWNREYYMLLFACCLPDGDANQNRVVKFDSLGNILWEVMPYYPPEAKPEQIKIFPTDMTVAKDGSVYFYSRATFETMMLNKIDRHGRILWHKLYAGEPVGMGGSYRGLDLTPDSLGVYMVTRTFESKSKYLSYRIDSAGNTVWYNAFNVPIPNGKGDVGLNLPVLRLRDNTLVGAYDNNFVSNYSDHFLRMDSLGRPIKFATSTHPARTRDLALHPNGNVIYLSEASNVEIGLPPGGICTQMLTPDLDTVWTHVFYDYEPPVFLNVNVIVKNVSVHPSGKILVSGSSHSHFVHLACLSEQGKLLWYREIGVTEPVPYHTITRFGEAIWTSDGGILVNGESYGTPPLAQYQSNKSFLLKLDSLGCLSPGCKDTRITAVIQPKSETQQLSIQPNPAGQVARIAWGHPAEQSWNLAIHDLLGRQLAFWTLSDGESHRDIDLSSFKEGLYWLRLTNNGLTLGTGKLVRGR